jgi:hypothetical protein
MAKFTKSEEQLLKLVTDDHLCESLALIRQAAEDIWADDAPRIVQDYTDHGIHHSERLAGFAASLLDANDGRDLSSQEMYLLLAGIYLHDIGMQCDVVKFPEIKARAEKLGARFGVEFVAQTSSGYSVVEQKAIRQNHQYLAAAWIDYAYRTKDRDKETVLGPAAKTIPANLVSDLMDVCQHHAKLPITDCPVAFRFDPTERKQLVATILRFADELDVDGHRVSIETVKTFALDPHNSVYWWLHNRTKVIFTARNVILLTILLHPNDVKQYGSFVHAAFITEFQTKNQPGLTVLGQNGIPMLISADSKVMEDDYAEPLPPEIIQALQAMQQRGDPLLALAGEVRTWLQAIRYEVSEPQRRDDRTVDMIAALEQGTLRQRVLIRCIDGEIVASDVDALDESLDRKTPQGWLISDKRVSDLARKRAAEDEAFQVFNLSDFLRQTVWRPYFDALTSLVEKDHIPDLYVDLACYKQEMDEQGREVRRDRHTSLDEYIDDWLKERGKMHISLLGEFGTGKTWFCRHYAYRQLARYLADPANERLPLLITLRAFAKAMTPQQLINDALLEQYKLPFVGSAFEVFQEMNRRGKLLLILDGFDEMARHVDYQTVVDNFWQLASLVDEGSKVILTSRTEYFRWAKESEKILGGEEYGRRTIVLTPPKFEALHLEPFSDEQIRQVITRRLGAEEGPVVADRILATENLAEMARKPVLVELLLAALDEVSADVLENSAQVYLYATNRLLLRNIDTQRTFTSTADKLYFLCELAWEMIKSGELRIHYTAIPERIKVYFGDRIKDQHELDTWDFDLRNQTLLHRDAAGYYEFAHKSLAEYFVAFKFASELGSLAPAFAQTYCEADRQPCKIPIGQKDIIGLAETLGAMALKDRRMQTVCDLLPGMMASDAAKRLWEIIGETRGRTSEQVKYAGGNAATLLNWIGESFTGRNLMRTMLAGAGLHEADLAAADLTYAVLDNAELLRANLKGAHCAGTSFRDARLSNTSMEQAVFEDADFTGAHIEYSDFILTLSFSPDGHRIASGGGRREVPIWDIRTGEEILYCSGHAGSVQVVCFSPQGELLASGGGDGYVRTWDPLTGKAMWSRKAHKDFVRGLSFDPTGRWLASVGEDSKVNIWDTSTGEKYLSFQGSKGMLCVSFSPDGRLLAAGGRNGTLVVWNLLEGKEVHGWQAHKEVLFVAFSSDSSLLISGGIDTLILAEGSAKGSIKIWEAVKWRKMSSIGFDYAGGWLHGSVSPSNTYVAGKTGESNIAIWDYRTGEQLFLMRGHYATVYSTIFSPDGNCIASSLSESLTMVR